MAKRVAADKSSEINADRIVAGLIEELRRTQSRIADLTKQVQEQYTMIAENQPRLTSDGKIALRVMLADQPKEAIVKVQPVSEPEPI